MAGLGTVGIIAVLAIVIFLYGFGNDDSAGQTTQPADTGGAGNTCQQEEAGGEELGSLAVTGYLCPSASSPENA